MAWSQTLRTRSLRSRTLKTHFWEKNAFCEDILIESLKILPPRRQWQSKMLKYLEYFTILQQQKIIRRKLSTKWVTITKQTTVQIKWDLIFYVLKIFKVDPVRLILDKCFFSVLHSCESGSGWILIFPWIRNFVVDPELVALARKCNRNFTSFLLYIIVQKIQWNVPIK